MLSVSTASSSTRAYRRVAAASAGGPVPAVDAVRKIGPRGARPMQEGAALASEQAAIVAISDEARQLTRASGSANEQQGEANAGPKDPQNGPERAGAASGPELTEEEEKQVEELRDRDLEVRAHEQAHKSVGGQYAGSIHYDFQRGPDGRNYAVGGHVNIDVSEVSGDPAATVTKMQQVIRAALAPADPSSADRAVAARASSRAAEARRELAEESNPSERESTVERGPTGGDRAAAQGGSAIREVEPGASSRVGDWGLEDALSQALSRRVA